MIRLATQTLKNKQLKAKKLFLAVSVMSMASASHGALSIQNHAKAGTAKIAWGGEDSLTQAKAIMYGNTSNTTAGKTYTDVYNGASQNVNSNVYNDGSTISNNTSYNTTGYNTDYSANQLNNYNNYDSNNSYNTYNGGYDSYSSESLGSTAQVFKKYKHDYSELPGSMSAAADVDKLDISTSSRGVMVVDAASGEPLYQKNANVARPIASITKVMTAMVILDSGQNLNEELTVRSSDRRARIKTNYYKLNAGDRLSRGKMLLMALMVSDNASAKALARNYPGGTQAFLRAMNRKAQSLGMYSAKFYDPSGLDERNVASPADLVKMFKAASNYPLIRQYSTTTSHNFYIANAHGGRNYTGRSTNKLVKSGYYPIGLQKTGYIRKAGKCVVMETRYNNRPAIVVLLGASDSPHRWSDARTILNNLSFRRYI